MNYSAEIVAAIQDEGMHDADALADRVGLSTKAFDALISKLCGEGTLHRNGDRLTIGNEGRARMLAEQARKEKAPARAMTLDVPSFLGQTVGQTRAPILKDAPADPPKASRPARARIQFVPPANIKIESNVPIPPRYRPGRGIPWPFMGMEVGKSFAVPIGEHTPETVVAILARDAAAFRSRIKPDFYVRIRVEATGDSVRLWRVEKYAAGTASEQPAKTKAKATAQTLGDALAGHHSPRQFTDGKPKPGRVAR